MWQGAGTGGPSPGAAKCQGGVPWSSISFPLGELPEKSGGGGLGEDFVGSGCPVGLQHSIDKLPRWGLWGYVVGIPPAGGLGSIPKCLRPRQDLGGSAGRL